MDPEVSSDGERNRCSLHSSRSDASVSIACEVVVRTLHLEAWAGSWVAVNNEDHVVASSPIVKDLMAALDLQGIQDVEIMRAPDPSAAIPHGLG